MEEAKVPYHTVPVRNQESVQSDSEELTDAEVTEDEGDADEPNAKKRNIDAGKSKVSLSHKTVSEPRFIVQTRSEVDRLDDGYRWRKYGQKVPTENRHSRSYYKCTSAGCRVRKCVETDSTGAKVGITYKGSHNHDVPAAGNSSHNTANNTAQHFQPDKLVAEKHPLLKDIEYGKKDQRPVLLQLKDEQITVSESDIVDAVVKDVKEKLKFIGSNGRIEDLLKRLEAKLRSANMVLNDAEEKQLTNQVVKEWLDDFKEVIFRADDLRDKINYEELRRKLEGASESSTLCATFIKSVEDEIAEILLKLEELTAQKDELGLKELTENIVSQSSHGAPLALKPEVYGREDYKEAIMKLALSDETYGDKVPMVLPTVGTGGTSKTTLAEDLNAHPDLLRIIGEEMGDIAKTNLGEDLNAHREEIVNKCKA